VSSPRANAARTPAALQILRDAQVLARLPHGDPEAKGEIPPRIVDRVVLAQLPRELEPTSGRGAQVRRQRRQLPIPTLRLTPARLAASSVISTVVATPVNTP
jgi:hypothetical protein